MRNNGKFYFITIFLISDMYSLYEFFVYISRYKSNMGV